MTFSPVRLFLLALIILPAAVAQADPWKLSLESNLTATLNTYSGNWTGKEQGAFSWASRATGIAERQLTPWLNSKSTLKMAFGQTALQAEDSLSGKRSWTSLAKSTDQIDFESLLKFNVGGFIDPYAAAQVVTQFYEEKPGMLRYGNPANIKESFGAAREIIKKSRLVWNARLGGAVKERVDRYQTGPARIATDCGFDFVSEFKVDRYRDIITVLSRVNVFEAVYKFDAPKGTNVYRRPDLKWENSLTISLTKYIMLNYLAEVNYDADILREFRFRQVFGAGFNVQISNAGPAPSAPIN